jgi:hypothetical protein
MSIVATINIQVEIQTGDDGEPLMGREELQIALQTTVSEFEDILNRKPFTAGIYDTNFDVEEE